MSSDFSLPGEPGISTPEQFQEQRFNRIEQVLYKMLAAGETTLQKVDIEDYVSPQESEIVIDWPTNRFCWYHDGQWHCTPADPEHAIKVYGDTKTNQVKDGAFKFTVEESLDNFDIIWVEGGNGEAGGSSNIMQISNRTRNIDLLTTRITIPAGSYSSKDAGSQPVIDKSLSTGGIPANRVRWGDRIWIDVDAASGKGLHVYIRFRPMRIDSV